MRYIRTFSGIIVDTEQQAKRLGMSVEEYESKFPYSCSTKADTIEELCDEFVVTADFYNKPNILTQVHSLPIDIDLTTHIIYGAIWTNKGLIYVAKMNEKGELCLL